jgi:uncharacterized protein
MPFRHPPPYAAWQHRDARDGFEVAFLSSDRDGHRFDGETAAVEHGRVWVVRYTISLDRRWLTRLARVTGRAEPGRAAMMLEADALGGWRIDGDPASDLDGCLDLDLESSALTNALPVRRLELGVGEEADAPAAYVHATDLNVERLEQHYKRLEDRDGKECYRYTAPRFRFECELIYDEFGLVIDYPGIAHRAA